MLASFFFLPLLGLAVTTTVAGPAPTPRTAPAAPATQYLFTVAISSAAPIELGDTPAGQRAFQPISGGNFSGPGLQGKFTGKSTTIDRKRKKKLEKEGERRKKKRGGGRDKEEK